MSNRLIISVVGDASYQYLSPAQKDELHSLAYDLGKLLIDNGYLLATGGLGGVMESVSMGARDSKHYKEGCILGLLPNYQKKFANEYVDIALPLGFELGRNISLASVCDALVIIGGGSGSLSEVALAWQLKKLIIALTSTQENSKHTLWANILANRTLDNRRRDKVWGAKSAKEVLDLLSINLPKFSNISFKGIAQSKLRSQKEARALLFKVYGVEDLEYLGCGSEGYIFSDQKTIYKIFHNAPLSLYFNLLTLSENLQNSCNFFVDFKVTLYENTLMLTYPYFKATPLDRLKDLILPKECFIELLNNLYFSNLVHCDLQPKNLLVDTNTHLSVCDIGKDLVAYSKTLFDSMARRAFAIYKLQGREYANSIKDFLSPLNTREDFSLLENFLGVCDLRSEYQNFATHLGATATYKAMIFDFYKQHKNLVSIFDYGSGSGSIAKFLQTKLNRQVSAYEIDTTQIQSHFQNYKDLKGYYSSKEEILELMLKGVKFNSVLCSLVLCHPLSQNHKVAEKIVEEILRDITALSLEHILIVICNPLFFNTHSTIQKKLSPKECSYSSNIKIKKQMLVTNKERIDFHRPLGFYENLCKKFHLEIREIFLSGDAKNNAFRVVNSDFMFLSCYIS